MGRKMGSWIAVVALGLAAPAAAKSAIVGGKSVSIKEAPWQLLLRAGGGVCGAAWVGGRWVVTAAHCVEGASATSTYVHAGITRYREAVNTNRIAVKRIVRNPKNTGISQDLALLELSADITSPLAKPIRYATPADATAGLTDKGKWCMATGWGKLSPTKGLADSLQLVESVIYNTSTYVIRWAGQGGTEHIGSCQGDSGGPLVVKDGKGEFLLVGISSFITSFCGDPRSASGYARVSAIAYFIQEHVNQMPTGLARQGFGGNLTFPGPGRFALHADQPLDLTWIAADGSLAARKAEWFPAGEHALARPGLAMGAYLVRLRGAHGEVVRPVRIAP